jgi:putative membrane protein
MTEPERRSPRPRAFRLEGDTIVPPKSRTQNPEAPGPDIVEPDADVFANTLAGLAAGAEGSERATETAQAKGGMLGFFFSMSGMFWSALTGLVSLALTLWVTQLVEGLFAHSAILGAIGLVFAGALLVAALVLIAREIRAMLRQNHIAKLHVALAAAHEKDDGAAARENLKDLCKLYENRPETAKARAHLLELFGQIVDGRDLIDVAERTLIGPLDILARREIAAASKRVSVFTTVSPRALLDVFFVAGQAIMLMRRIAEIYGGRPGLLGFFKLARSVGAHLTITGGLAIGDSLLQQLVGHGLAAKLSARLGEGVLNGLLTARVGLSAMAVCRPTPFAAEKPPGVKDVAPFLFGDKGKDGA